MIRHLHVVALVERVFDREVGLFGVEELGLDLDALLVVGAVVLDDGDAGQSRAANQSG